jgi:enoyl-CoA hydratase/carnithine racemase
VAQSAKDIDVSFRNDGQIAWLTFDTHSPSNAFTLNLLQEFHAALDEITKHAPRVLVVVGRPENFTRGADIKQIEGMGERFKDYIVLEFDLFHRIESLPFVTAAALRGVCIGNGAELALACDFRIAAASSRIGLPEVSIGFVGPALRLCRYVGIGIAKEMLLGARMLDAETALRHGLVTRVVPDGEFEKGVLDFAAEYAERPPIAIRVTKEGIARAFQIEQADDAPEREAAYLTYCSEDGKEGFASFRERRRPVFKGR